MRRIVKPSAVSKTQLEAYKLSTKLKVSIDFPLQNDFVNDTERFIAAQCSRRAGKSNGLAYRFFLTMEKHPKTTCIYLALTRDSAKQIMWPVLQEINEKYNIGCVFKESDLSVTHPNGSKLMLYGADMANFIRRLKGQKSPGIGVDEAQDFGTHLESLLNDVLTPMLVDYTDSWLAVVGTPGPVPQGYYFDITHLGKYKYSVHKWTLLDNPFIPNAEKFIADLIERHQWENTHPTLMREWRNQWVLDVDALWIRYKAEVNHYDELPKVKKWNYILGIDIGFKDSDALAILAWSEEDPCTYLVEELITAKQDITSLIEQIGLLEKTYKPYKMVIDQGGLGLKIAEEIRKRHGIPIEAADKKLKSENVGILNDELRLGKFKAKDKSRFAQDSYLIQIDWLKSTPDKIVIKKDPHSDIIDAVLYAHKESYAFTHQKLKEAPRPGTKEWAAMQTNEMWETAQNHFAQEALDIKRMNGEYE